MTYVLVENGVVTQRQPNPQEGFIEATGDVVCGWLYDGSAFSAPTPPAPVAQPAHLNNSRLVRFTGANPPVVLENIGMGSVLRISAGRYRCFHEGSMPSASYSFSVNYLDASPKNIRIQSRTATYVEVRCVDNLGVAADPAEIVLETLRVVT